MLAFKLIDYAQLSCFRGEEMVRLKLRDDQWERIQHLLPGKVSDRGRSGHDCIQRFQRVATRYDKLDRCYLAFVMRALILICLA